MLDLLKNMINEKKSFMESSDTLIVENEELDDSIVLGEEPVVDDVSAEAPVEDEPKPDEKAGKDTLVNDNGLLNDDISDEKDELPTPIGTQTGEPASIGDEAIISQDFNLVTNTPTDTLPIPPAGASDAVVTDNLLDQPIDPGFGADINDAPAKNDLLDQPIDNPNPEVDPTPNEEPEKNSGDLLNADIDDDDTAEKKLTAEEVDNSIINSDTDDGLTESADLLQEAITFDGGNSENNDSSDNASDVNDSNEAPDANQGTDNAVTQAVKDKVGEINAEDDTSNMDVEIDEPAADNLSADASKTIQKKLSNLTKDIESIKNFVVDNMQ